MHARTRLGRAGEELAARSLERQGFAILARNYACREGEIDVIAARGPLVVFCEVKTRHGDAFGQPSEAVGWAKQARLRAAGARWLRERGAGHRRVRFDVISIVVREGRAHATHIPAAF